MRPSPLQRVMGYETQAFNETAKALKTFLSPPFCILQNTKYRKESESHGAYPSISLSFIILDFYWGSQKLFYFFFSILDIPKPFLSIMDSLH